MFNEINSEKYDLKYNGNIINNYIIASTPRSGSTLLGKILENTKVAGMPLEYFHNKHSKDYLTRWEISNISDFIKKLHKYRTTSNGIFGIKLHFHQLKNFNIEVKELYTLFNNPKYIFIKRENKLLQAISFVKAMQTKQWALSHHEKLLHAVYDFDAIKNSIESLEKEERMWEIFFNTNNISPYTLIYENFINDIDFYIQDIIKFLGINNYSLSIQKIPFQKMANKETIEWSKRFMEDNEQN